MLAVRVWLTTYALWFAHLAAKLSMGRTSKAARDWALARQAKRLQKTELIWDDETAPTSVTPMRAAE